MKSYIWRDHRGCSSFLSISLLQCMVSCDVCCQSYFMAISAQLLYLSLVKTLTNGQDSILEQSLAAHRKWNLDLCLASFSFFYFLFLWLHLRQSWADTSKNHCQNHYVPSCLSNKSTYTFFSRKITRFYRKRIRFRGTSTYAFMVLLYWCYEVGMFNFC